LVAVPLLSSGQVIGVLAVSAEKPEAFTAEDEALGLLLANCTVPIIERARLERLALVDPLTQAYNDRYLVPRLRDELSQATQRATPLSVLMLDVDNLSKFNNDHGFEMGDRLLQQIAQRIRGCIDAPVRLVRRGGGTFVLLLPQSTEADATEQAEALRRAVTGSPFALSDELANSTADETGGELGGELSDGTADKTADKTADETAERSEDKQSISIGVACWDGQERPLELLQRADAAMKRAKRSGRDRVSRAEPPEGTT
jgi:diguanylate cyclase (GGDEF)-like protein